MPGWLKMSTEFADDASGENGFDRVQWIFSLALWCCIICTVLQRASRKVVGVIEKLATSMVAGNLTAKQKAKIKNNPEYW